MKSSTTFESDSHSSQQGFILFLVMGVLAVLSLAALIALTSARLESRTSMNHYHSVRALYHAEAGVKLVKMEVERRLQAGESLSTILNNLTVSAPSALEFDTIDDFKVIVPERLFSFEALGRSGDAVASVVVQYRRYPVVTIGLFGDLRFGAQNHTSIYGYDSRVISNPTSADNNGGASIGSNGEIVLGNNNFTFDGSILLGETGSGLVASCTRCDSTDYTKLEIGMVDPDPMGLTNGGTLADTFTEAISNNDNLSANIFNNTLSIGSGNTFTLPTGDYYLTSFYMSPNASLDLDNEDGPVRIFLDGPFRMQPNGNAILGEDEAPTGFQIFSRSTEEIRLQPDSSLAAFVYAPNAEVQIQPKGDFNGNVWAREIQIQPDGDIFVDTSIADQMLLNSLEIHAWYEQQGL
ncbi:MAG: pilus assembly PilX N-terminal domain-containing protein [Kiritimatiellia bacterium]